MVPGKLAGAIAAITILGAAAILITKGFPKVDSDPNTLRPTGNKTIEFYEELTKRLSQKDIGRRRFIISGEDDNEVSKALAKVEEFGESSEFLNGNPPILAPSQLWPDPTTSGSKPQKGSGDRDQSTRDQSYSRRLLRG